MRVGGSLSKSWDLAPGVLAATMALLAPLAGWAASDSECQAYSRIALMQVAIAKGMQHGGIGDGCAGAEGPRWTDNKAEHFNWCLETEPDFVADEQKARRDLLLDCTARRGNQKWYGWDDKSCRTHSGGLGCMQNPDEYGKHQCEGQGRQILNAVKAVQNDPNILFDDAKDKNFYHSKYYHHFQHWKDFRCVLGMSTPHTRAYFLEGWTGVDVEAKPRDVPIAAPPPKESERPFVTKRRTGPFTKD